jgi:excisionase family DNA binding protein
VTDELVSVRDVATQLGVHPETIRRLIHDGRLEGVRVGRLLRVRRSDLEQFLQVHRVRPEK